MLVKYRVSSIEHRVSNFIITIAAELDKYFLAPLEIFCFCIISPIVEFLTGVNLTVLTIAHWLSGKLPDSTNSKANTVRLACLVDAVELVVAWR